ncbi:uncharacterized protein isoform X2 [Rhodnius prolixus]|uniref:uncharacterized protein isoform X2 n=1 Tax=Rhodnius prolixus TaxID=13249 RepID=UPI003D1891C2
MKVTMDGHSDIFKDLYAESILTCTFGIPPKDFYKKIVPKHIFILICVFTMLGNSFVLFYLAANSGASPFILASKMFIPTHYLFYIFEWAYLIYYVKFLSKIDLNLKYSKALKFASNSAYKELMQRQEIYTKCLSWFKKTYFGVAIIFVVVPAIQAIFDWFNNMPLKSLVVLPLTEIPNDPVYILCLYLFQSPSTFFCVILRTGVYEWAASFVFLISAQVKVMELALKLQVDKKRIMPLRYFIYDHVMLLKKVDQFLWCFQTITSSKIFLCVVNFSFFTFLMGSAELSGNESPLKFIGADVIMLGEVLVFCYMGTIIKYSLREISNIVYDSPWDELGVSYKRDAAFIIQRAQISAEPTAWFGTIKIDLPTVIDVMQLCYSVYNLFIFLK